MGLVSSLFSVGPRVSKRQGQLIADTAWRIRILTVGTLYRKVVVDPHKKMLTVSRRFFWLFTRHRRIKFEAIEAVTYTYEDMSPDASLSWAHDSLDIFSVGLRLHNLEELRLFYFLGAGTFTNEGPLPDWMYWEEYLFDASGSQEGESRRFVDLLGKMIGVAVVPGRG